VGTWKPSLSTPLALSEAWLGRVQQGPGLAVRYDHLSWDYLESLLTGLAAEEVPYPDSHHTVSFSLPRSIALSSEADLMGNLGSSSQVPSCLLILGEFFPSRLFSELCSILLCLGQEFFCAYNCTFKSVKSKGSALAQSLINVLVNQVETSFSSKSLLSLSIVVP